MASSTQQWVGSWCMCMTDKVWWVFEVPCPCLYQSVLHWASPWQTETWHCRGTAGRFPVELGHRPHTSAYRAARNMAWNKKENLLGCMLIWSIQEYHYSCHSGKRGGSRAGADGNVLLLHMVGDWSQRENLDQQHSILSYFLPSQMHNWWEREQISGTNGNKDCYKAHPQQLT